MSRYGEPVYAHNSNERDWDVTLEAPSGNRYAIRVRAVAKFQAKKLALGKHPAWRYIDAIKYTF